jgi:hypothetical protein
MALPHLISTPGFRIFFPFLLATSGFEAYRGKMKNQTHIYL